MSLREESAPLPAELAPGRLRIPSALAWLRRSGPVIPVAAGVLWLSLKGGGYALTVRSPAAIAIWAALPWGSR